MTHEHTSKLTQVLGMALIGSAGVLARAETLHVPDQYATIQAAIEATQPGDVVEVADGIYTGDGNRDIDFGGKLITVRSANGPENCIIDCGGGIHRGVYFHSGETVAAVFEGFTIRSGFVSNSGGGMLIEEASPTVTNCIFTDNQARWTRGQDPVVRGGGVAVLQGAPVFSDCLFFDNFVQGDCDDDSLGGGFFTSGSPTLLRCLFRENTAESDCKASRPYGTGGGMYIAQGTAVLNECAFENNQSDIGGGIHIVEGSVVLNACRFEGNRAWRGGGLSQINGTLSMTSCSFVANRGKAGSFGGGSGGGVWFGNGSVVLNACSFENNVAGKGGGGGLKNVNATLSMTNCSFVGNSTRGGGRFGGYGDGAGVSTGGLSSLINCTFYANVANHANAVGGGIFVDIDAQATLANCILWGDSPDEIGDKGSATVTYSNVQGGWDGAGNIDTDPMFVDPNNGDYRLSAGSPSIDAADNEEVPDGITTDLDGNPRFVDDPETQDTGNGNAPIVDMGAYEFQVACEADLDGDGDTDSKDFFAYLDAFAGGNTDVCDIDGDGDCDADDFFGYLDLFARGCS